MGKLDIIILIVALILLLHLLLCFLLSNFLFKWGDKNYKDIFKLEEMIPQYQLFYDSFKRGQDYLLENKYDEIDIKSFDNLNLHGYLFINNDLKNFAILVHGYHCAGLFEYAKLLKTYKELGYNVLIIDQRAHFKSDGKYTGFAQKEKYDLHSWTSYLKNRFGNDINILFQGSSMGSASIMFSLEIPYDVNVKAIVLDCGFSNAYKVLLANEKKKIHIPLPCTTFVALLLTSLRFRINLFKSTEKILKNNKIPTLFMHTVTDEVVPFKQCMSNYKANGAKINELVSYEDGRHTEVFLKYEDESKEKLKDFIIRNKLN